MTQPIRGRYDRLEASKVLSSLTRLRDRISAAFPDRNLPLVVDEVQQVVVRIVAEQNRAPWRAGVVLASRAGIIGLVALVVVALFQAVRTGLGTVGDVQPFDWLQIVEAGVNDIVFAAVAIWFLRSVPERLHRRRALAILYRLRSLAHITDMHQMTKDIDKELASGGYQAPQYDVMSEADLGRYYDFCSELLTLTSKAAALCAEDAADPLVLDTISEIESLTSSMSRKIWQKITLLQTSTSQNSPDLSLSQD